MKFGKIKFLFLLIIAVNLFTFALADTECANKDCFVGISINVIEGPNGNFSGSVRDLSSGLIENANVVILGTFYSTVAATGNYAITKVPVGMYSLKASADGYLSQTKTNEVIGGEITTTVDFTLAPTGGIKGNVLDFWTSNTINNANITLILYGDALSSTLTNANGYYEFINLAPGYYNINVMASGYNPNSKPNNQVLSSKNTTVNFWLW